MTLPNTRLVLGFAIGCTMAAGLELLLEGTTLSRWAIIAGAWLVVATALIKERRRAKRRRRLELVPEQLREHP